MDDGEKKPRSAKSAASTMTLARISAVCSCLLRHFFDHNNNNSTSRHPRRWRRSARHALGGRPRALARQDWRHSPSQRTSANSKRRANSRWRQCGALRRTHHVTSLGGWCFCIRSLTDAQSQNCPGSLGLGAGTNSDRKEESH